MTIIFCSVNPVIMQQALWVAMSYCILDNAELKHWKALIFIPVNLILLFESNLKCQYTHFYDVL